MRIASVVLLGTLCLAQKADHTGTLVDRVGSTGFIQLQAPSFKSMDARQKQLAYWLCQAAVAIDPIIYDQLSAYGLREKRMLEEIVAHPSGIDPALMKKIVSYAKLFWASRGNHNDLTSRKFVPDFHADDLQAAAAQAFRNGAFRSAAGDVPALDSADAVRQEVSSLSPAFFDPAFQPMSTAKSPPPGQNILQASSVTFYRKGVTPEELKSFEPKYPLNSTVVRHEGRLEEEVWRAGTPDGSVAPGRYAVYLKKAAECLTKAQALADAEQAGAIGHLIRYYQTGDPADWLAFGADWVRNNATVDFDNGFIEVYRDPLGAKGSAQSFVTVTDKPLTDTMNRLARNAEYFEQKAPWLPQYKKSSFTPPVVKAVETLVEAGDFHVGTIGDNLPNENEIHEKYGTKNFLFTASSRAIQGAAGNSTLEEFGASPAVIRRGTRYGQEAEELLTALHEVIGHGSGKLSPRLAATGAESSLKEYFSTLEEARADLSAYWNVWDPKLRELGLVSNQDEVAKAMYDSAALVALTQIRRIPEGDTIEEDHERDRALIANYIMDTAGAIRMFSRGGKQYIEVTDYPKMHEAVGRLLAELMRIKGEGDYSAIKTLVERYGVHFDPKLRDQVVARYRKLNIPTYWAGVNPQVTEAGAISYPADAVKQYLGYAAMYNPGLAAQ